MEARELRIGNWVFVKEVDLDNGNDIFVPIKIKGNDIRFIEIRNDGGTAHFPIPITTEILLKCGLLKNNIGIWNNGDSIYFSYGFEKDVKLEYLHQLQNLYFALTGEELEVNL